MGWCFCHRVKKSDISASYLGLLRSTSFHFSFTYTLSSFSQIIMLFGLMMEFFFANSVRLPLFLFSFMCIFCRHSSYHNGYVTMCAWTWCGYHVKRVIKVKSFSFQTVLFTLTFTSIFVVYSFTLFSNMLDICMVKK